MPRASAEGKRKRNGKIHRAGLHHVRVLLNASPAPEHTENAIAMVRHRISSVRLTRFDLNVFQTLINGLNELERPLDVDSVCPRGH